MATKTIFKDVVIRDRHLGRALANALESTHHFRQTEPVHHQRMQEIKKEDVKKFFGEETDAAL